MATINLENWNATQSAVPATTQNTLSTGTPVTGSNYVAQTLGANGQPANYTSPTPVMINNPAQAGVSVQSSLDQLLAADNPYIQNARTTGLEQAAARGLRNSSIAAGNSQRAAIESAVPILDQITGLQKQRESIAASTEQSGFDRELQAQQAALDRTQQVNNAVLASDLDRQKAAENYQYQSWLQADQAKQQDWLSSNQYTRQFNAELAAIPIKNAADLATYIAQYAVQNPDVYSPNVASGMQNFFTGSFLTMMQQYFPSLVNKS